MIDVRDIASMVAESRRRQGLIARGFTTFGDPTPPAPEPSPRDASALEKTEQQEVRKRFIVCGFRVYNLSQTRASKQTPGLADLWLVHRELPLALWWETKRQVGGAHSTAQRDFAAECARCHVGYGTGDRHDAEQYLVSTGRARIVAGALEPIPPSSQPRSLP